MLSTELVLVILLLAKLIVPNVLVPGTVKFVVRVVPFTVRSFVGEAVLIPTRELTTSR
jgi:hypothetical protein